MKKKNEEPNEKKKVFAGQKEQTPTNVQKCRYGRFGDEQTAEGDARTPEKVIL